MKRHVQTGTWQWVYMCVQNRAGRTWPSLPGGLYCAGCHRCTLCALPRHSFPQQRCEAKPKHSSGQGSQVGVWCGLDLNSPIRRGGLRYSCNIQGGATLGGTAQDAYCSCPHCFFYQVMRCRLASISQFSQNGPLPSACSHCLVSVVCDVSGSSTACCIAT